MPASQEFRDGASQAAREVYHRLKTVEQMGVEVNLDIVHQVTNTIAEEMGGRGRLSIKPVDPSAVTAADLLGHHD